MHIIRSSLAAHAGSPALSLVLDLEDEEPDSMADHEQMHRPQELQAKPAWPIMLPQQQQEVQLALIHARRQLIGTAGII